MWSFGPVSLDGTLPPMIGLGATLASQKLLNLSAQTVQGFANIGNGGFELGGYSHSRLQTVQNIPHLFLVAGLKLHRIHTCKALLRGDDLEH